MKNLTIVITMFLILLAPGIKLLSSENPVILKKVFTNEDIKKLADVYVGNNLGLKNPAIVDVDKDGDFDALKLIDGNVEYYKNNGSLENPVFILENKNYDEYSFPLIEPEIPFPVFFADNDGDKDLDMFVVNDKEYNRGEQRYNYNVLTAGNSLDLDTGTLITIILILIIVVLVLAIVK